MKSAPRGADRRGGQDPGGDHRDVPADFVAGIFARAVPEDLMRYDARQLAELAADAWSLLAVRKPGVPNIRFDRPPTAAGSRAQANSVLEIVNDDMPFLVDSVLASSPSAASMSASSCIRYSTVVRDAAGRLTAFKGCQAGCRRAARKLHPHPRRARSTTRRAAPRSWRRIERVLADVRAARRTTGAR